MKSEIDILREYIRSQGMRRTPERELILREVFALHEHFDVEELHERLRQVGHKVSKASIYRSLRLFLDCVLIREVDFREGHWHYEHIYGHSHHYHLRCLSCGEMVEFDDPVLAPVEEQLSQKYGYHVVGSHLEVKGYCQECRK